MKRTLMQLVYAVEILVLANALAALCLVRGVRAFDLRPAASKGSPPAYAPRPWRDDLLERVPHGPRRRRNC